MSKRASQEGSSSPEEFLREEEGNSPKRAVEKGGDEVKEFLEEGRVGQSQARAFEKEKAPSNEASEEGVSRSAVPAKSSTRESEFLDLLNKVYQKYPQDHSAVKQSGNVFKGLVSAISHLDEQDPLRQALHKFAIATADQELRINCAISQREEDIARLRSIVVNQNRKIEDLEKKVNQMANILFSSQDIQGQENSSEGNVVASSASGAPENPADVLGFDFSSRSPSPSFVQGLAKLLGDSRGGSNRGSPQNF